MFDENAVTRRASSDPLLTTASLASTGTTRLLTIRAAGLLVPADVPKGTPTGIQLILFRMGEQFAPGDYQCGSGPAKISITAKGEGIPYEGPPGSCTITLTAVPTQTGQKVAGTFSGTLNGFFGPPKTITNGRFELVTAVASN